MNNAALNSAWATRSSQPAVAVADVPAPKSTIMNPSWLTVPYASSSLSVVLAQRLQRHRR